MSSTRDRAGGRGREDKPSLPLRKPGEIRTPEIAENNISQDDEKPPVQKPELTVNVASESGPKQLAQDVGTERKVENSTIEIESQNVDNVLLRAVNNPVFVPKTSQQTFNPAQTLSSRLASAINAPEFVPGKCFSRHEEPAEERLQAIEHFVNNKIKQLTEDPGLLDELSMSMANYLSVYIRVENDMIKLSDLLFEKCVSEQNFQYTGSKLANHLDKYLVPKMTEQFQFRTVFLQRCKSENDIFNDVIQTNPERACNVAIFLGELLMNFK
ncbi:polyadenylate-binding -interacting 1 isoform X1, partial [Paramuricea clavata]